MSPVHAVFRKEVAENFRDRRTLMSALLMGPVFGPVLFAFVISMALEQSLSDEGASLDVPVIGQELAPNLMRFLDSKNINVTEPPASRDQAIEDVKTGVSDIILVVHENFAEDLRESVPATVEVISDQANTRAERESRRVLYALRAYNQQLASLRLAARGLSPVITKPMNVDVVDVSTPSGRSAMLLGMLTYFFIFALLSGGMNLAIDATAGERERGSLEPLLCLPVKRDQLIFGKIFAACTFMILSMFLSLVSFYFMLNFVPLEELGMTPNFGPFEVIKAFGILLPFSLLGAAMMTLVASFTKSYKEAQTWLSVVILAPTLPILIVSILMVRSSTELMLVPALSQHLLLISLIKNEALSAIDILVSAGSTLAIGTIVTLVCARLYRREALLG